MDNERLVKELENSKEDVYNVKKALEDEIETMKEREGHLKSTNDLLQKGLEE